MPDGSLLHTSVEQRANAVESYRPKNLGPFETLRQRFKIVADQGAASSDTQLTDIAAG